MGTVAATVRLQCQVFRIKSYWIYQMNNIIISHWNASVDDVQKWPNICMKTLNQSSESSNVPSVFECVRVLRWPWFNMAIYVLVLSHSIPIADDKSFANFAFNQHNIAAAIADRFTHFIHNKLILAAFAQINFNLITCICFQLLLWLWTYSIFFWYIDCEISCCGFSFNLLSHLWLNIYLEMSYVKT